MTIHLPLFIDKTVLPTGKYHVSYSEVNTACGTDGCGWKHKLKYIGNLTEPDNEHTTYGKTLHSALEAWLLENESAWFDWETRIEDCIKEVQSEFVRVSFDPGPTTLSKEWLQPAKDILMEIPDWMDQQFPGWKPIAAELSLFEPIQGHTNKWFKGFIDAVIKVPKPARKNSKKPAQGSVYWILDWKTTSWGWDSKKKQDKFKRMQLALYKHYLSSKLNIPLDDIKCGFVLLKRTAKVGNKCELLEVSVGEKTRQEAVDLVSECVSMISKRFFMKNRNSCRFCTFRNTQHCS